MSIDTPRGRQTEVMHLIGQVMAGKRSSAEAAQKIEELYQRERITTAAMTGPIPTIAADPLAAALDDEAEDHTWEDDSPEVVAAIAADPKVQQIRERLDEGTGEAAAPKRHRPGRRTTPEQS